MDRKAQCNLNYMKPDSASQARIELVRSILTNTERELRKVLMPSRETALVWTNLEQVCMWATKGICLDSEVSLFRQKEDDNSVLMTLTDPSAA